MFPPLPGISSTANDIDLERRITAYLASRSFLSFRRIKVTARGGFVTLAGRLSSFHEKQVARESCRRVAGVLDIIDAIHVTPQSTPKIATLAVSL